MLRVVVQRKISKCEDNPDTRSSREDVIRRGQRNVDRREANPSHALRATGAPPGDREGSRRRTGGDETEERARETGACAAAGVGTKEGELGTDGAAPELPTHTVRPPSEIRLQREDGAGREGPSETESERGETRYRCPNNFVV